MVAAARHFGCDPAVLSERQAADFLLMLRCERKYAPSSMAQMIVALRTFFRDHLGQDWVLWKTVKVRQSESLPWVLSCAEVAAVIGAARLMRFRVLFTLIYHCGHQHFAYHGCGHRACPQCGHREAQEWLERQTSRLLPVTYHLVTFTVPAQLRPIIRSHQRLMLGILFRESAATMQDVAATKLRGELGLLGALHTWSRQLVYHPHIHYIVPGVALRKDGILVTPKDPDYLLCVNVLSVRMRTRFEHSLREEDPALFHQIPPSVWRKAWVVHSEPVGCGEHALKYLSRYIYRTAMSSERELAESNGNISFRYKDSKTREKKTAVLPVLVFIAMFLQHVLPKRFRRVRSYGWQSPAAKNKFARIRALLDALPACVPPTVLKEPIVICCPKCQKPMRLLGTFGRGPPR